MIRDDDGYNGNGTRMRVPGSPHVAASNGETAAGLIWWKGIDRYFKAEVVALARIMSSEKSSWLLNSIVMLTLIFTVGTLLSEAGLRVLPISG